MTNCCFCQDKVLFFVMTNCFCDKIMISLSQAQCQGWNVGVDPIT